jgi:thiamine biosynthesis lipoprotein
MGTTLEIAVSSTDRSRGFATIEAGFEQVRAVDSLINDWKSDSELSRLNRSAGGEAIQVSPRLYQLLQEVNRWARETDGAFDPAIGALVDAWGFRGTPHRPDSAGLARAREQSGLKRYQFLPGAIRLPLKNSWIDAGGFGKGAALRAARAALLARGATAGVMDFGGQVVVFGDTTWTLDVAHPSRRQEPAVRLRLRDASASTSAQSEHYIELGGERLGHVLDPRTGVPVPAWGSVTVIHPDPLVADLLSTALLVMGPEWGMDWARRHQVAALFLIDGPELETRSTLSMRPYLVNPPSHSSGG